MSVHTTFDLLLRGGRVIDPAAGVDGLKDVAVCNGKIAAVQSDILPTSAREVVDVTGEIVLPGLIDTHAHVYQYVTGRFGMNADIVGVQSGVTTLVDQGGASCMTLPGFRHFIAENAQSRTYADSAGEQLEHAQHYMTERVRERPLAATGAALGVGILIGLLLSSGRR